MKNVLINCSIPVFFYGCITIASEPCMPREVGHRMSLAVIDVITKSSPVILELGAIINTNFSKN